MPRKIVDLSARSNIIRQEPFGLLSGNVIQRNTWTTSVIPDRFCVPWGSNCLLTVA